MYSSFTVYLTIYLNFGNCLRTKHQVVKVLKYIRSCSMEDDGPLFYILFYGVEQVSSKNCYTFLMFQWGSANKAAITVLLLYTVFKLHRCTGTKGLLTLEQRRRWFACQFDIGDLPSHLLLYFLIHSYYILLIQLSMYNRTIA